MKSNLDIEVYNNKFKLMYEFTCVLSKKNHIDVGIIFGWIQLYYYFVANEIDFKLYYLSFLDDFVYNSRYLNELM